MKLKKWFSICGELFTYEDKIESSTGDVLIKLNKDSLKKKKNKNIWRVSKMFDVKVVVSLPGGKLSDLVLA